MRITSYWDLKNLSNDNNQRDRLIAQFVSVGVNSAINTNKNGGLYISY